MQGAKEASYWYGVGGQDLSQSGGSAEMRRWGSGAPRPPAGGPCARP